MLDEFADEIWWKALLWALRYWFKWKSPKLEDDPIAYALFKWMKFSVGKSANHARACIENWKKWWAPKGNSNAVKSFENVLKQPKSTQNNQEQRTTNNEQRTMNKEQKKK